MSRHRRRNSTYERNRQDVCKRAGAAAFTGFVSEISPQGQIGGKTDRKADTGPNESITNPPRAAGDVHPAYPRPFDRDLSLTGGNRQGLVGNGRKRSFVLLAGRVKHVYPIARS